MIWSGLILTLVKETLDLWTKGSWNWDDIVYGVIGWIVGLLFLKPHLVGFFSEHNYKIKSFSNFLTYNLVAN